MIRYHRVFVRHRLSTFHYEWDNLNWANTGHELKTLVRELYGSETKRVYGQPFYFRAGITYSQRTQRGLSFRCLPKDAIFNVKGPAVFLAEEYLPTMLGMLNSSLYKSIVDLQTAFGSYNVGYLQRTPFPHDAFSSTEAKILGKLTLQAVNLKRELAKNFEIEHIFSLPGFLPVEHDSFSDSNQAVQEKIACIRRKIDCIKEQSDLAALNLYGLCSADLARLKEFKEKDTVALDLTQEINPETDSAGLSEISDNTSSTASYLFGSAFGRWDIRYATGEKAAPELPDPFAPLPVCPPGQLQNEQGLPAGPGDVPEGYPVTIPWDGILVDDPNHPDDIVARSRQVMELIWHDKAADIEHEAAEILGVRELRDYFRKSAAGGFWPDHIKRYSKSRRKAPIYWQLATSSGTYSVWLYYHRFTSDTFFKILNEYARPKLAHERQKLDRLKGEFGAQPTRSQQKELETQESLIAELAEFTEEIQRVAPLWRPNLNDGVIINFAPLWRLVPQNKPWQKECKACWDSLVKGEYDWSHLAMHLWPERVVPKCQTDASLAIAHGLEAEFWQKDARDRYQPKPAPECGWEVVVKKLVAERQSPAVKASEESLMEAPVSQSGGKGGRKRKGTA